MGAYTTACLTCIVACTCAVTSGELSWQSHALIAAVWLLWASLRSSFVGLGHDDTIAIVAIALAIRTLQLLHKRFLTLLATYPLALSFKYLSPLIPKYSLDEEQVFSCDGCSDEVAARRKAALIKLSAKWKAKYPKCCELSDALNGMISDLRFTSGRCFPAFNSVVQDYLDPSIALDHTDGVNVVDLDGNSAMDISGSYGVNVCGYEQYKEFIQEGWSHAKRQGLFLGSLDRTVLENVSMLRDVSGHDEVSFHMSGTEAVMCAVRAARFSTRRRFVVTFGGAYHGWWDGLQPVAGNERLPHDVLCLRDMSALSLRVIEARKNEIAAVLVNALQCFHLNQSPPSDPVLSSNSRQLGPAPGYGGWLQKLRQTCSDAGVVLVLDEVYTGFRLHPRGAQGAYNVKADIVCYGKTLGGGLPIGVVCGPRHLMARSDATRAVRVNYVIGTFAGHPLVMACMHAFLKWLARPATAQSYVAMHENIASFVGRANTVFGDRGYPIRLVSWFSVWSVLYTAPGRYHWMLQYYLKDAGVNLSWVGTGRLLFSLAWQRADYDRLLERMLTACDQMRAGGWWEPPATSIGRKLLVEIGSSALSDLCTRRSSPGRHGRCGSCCQPTSGVWTECHAA